MKRKGPILPPGTSGGSVKRPFRSSVRRSRDGDDDDDDDESMGGNNMGVAAFLGNGEKKKKKDDDEDDLSDASGDEEAGETGRTKQRDRTMLHTIALKKQGIDLGGDDENLGDDEEEFREHLKKTEGEQASGLEFQSGKEQTDYQAPTQEQLQAIFGRDKDEARTGFSMGDRSAKYLYGKQGQVLEETVVEGGVKDAWLQGLEGPVDGEDPKQKTKQAGKAGQSMNLGNRLFNKAAGDMGPPIRRSKEPMTNLELILEHVQPRETILKALRRLGTAMKAGANRQQNKKKNVRTRPSKSGCDSDHKGPAVAAGAAPADAAKSKRSFDELTEAAQSLLDSGEIEIYSETHESVDRVLQRLRARKEAQLKAAEEQIRAKQEAQAKEAFELHWQYKWNASDIPVHGPFVGSEMEEWKADGYFDSGNVVAQRVGPNHAPGASREWVSTKDVDKYIK